MVNACGWVESTPSCLVCPQCDVLPMVLLLSDMEDCLLLAGKATIPLVWASFLRAVDQGSTNPPPPFNFTAPEGVWCQLLGPGTDSVDKPQAGYGHQTLPRWDTGFSSTVGQVILARSCQSVGGGILGGSCGMLGAEMPVAFTERMAVTTCEMERGSPRRGDAGTVLGGELGKQE